VTRSQQQALRHHLAGLSNEDAQRVLDELAGRMQLTAVNNPIRYCAALWVVSTAMYSPQS